MRVEPVNIYSYSFKSTKKDIPLILPDGVKISDSEKQILIKKLNEAHELAKQNVIKGNITGKGYATYAGTKDGIWYAGTNFNNTRDETSNSCGERSAITGVYNKWLQSGTDKDFKIKYLCLTSALDKGEDKNASRPCGECLAWLNTTRYFDDDTLLVYYEKDEKGNLNLAIKKLITYLPKRNETYKPVQNALGENKADIRISERAKYVIEKKGLSEEFLRMQYEYTKSEYQKNESARISGENACASVFANDKFYFGRKIDFTKRFNVNPLEFAAAKAIEDNEDKTKITSICLIGDDENSFNKLIDIKNLNGLSFNYASPSTVVITSSGGKLNIDTIADYMNDSYRYKLSYAVK